MSIEVLDDYLGEAEEVYSVNPWLNYTLATHRMREMGIQNKLFDLLDERRFSLSEIYDYCSMLFGASLVMLSQKARKEHIRSSGLQNRRLLFLAIFGLIHAYFIWYGDEK